MLMLVRKLALKQIFEIKTSLRLASEVSPKSRLCCHRKKNRNHRKKLIKTCQRALYLLWKVDFLHVFRA